MFDFPNGPVPGEVFEPNGAGTSPSYTFEGVGWIIGSTNALLISAVIPNTALVGSALLPTVRAIGANFTATTEVLIDNVAVATTPVSASEVTFPIDPSVEVAPRVITITVRDGATAGIGAVLFSFVDTLAMTWGVGIDETSPNVIDVRPANFNNEIGGVRIPARSATQGLSSDPTGLTVAPLANELLAGTIVEPLATDTPHARYRDASTGVASWRPITPATLPIAGNSAPEIGVVWVPDDRGLNLGADGELWLKPATSLHIGGLLEPTDPTNAKTFVRRVGSWIESAVTPDFGTGLAVDRTQTPNIVNLTAAGDGPTFLGGVYVIDRQRNMTEGLELGLDGRLRAPLATDSLAGTMREPPLDDRGYVRTFKGGVGAWVPPADTPIPDFGIGLSLVDGAPGDPQIVNLTPAGHEPRFLGGVYGTGPRTATEGLDIDPAAGRITVPLATDLLAGSIVEPPDDGQDYARRRTAGVSEWVQSSGVLVSDTPPDLATVPPNSLWWDSDAGDLFIAYQDADSRAWVQVNFTTPGVGTGGGITDAPTDGVLYGRRDGAWETTAPLADIDGGLF